MVRDAPGLAIGIDEGGSLDAIVALPIDDDGGIVFFDVDGFGVAVAGQPCGELIGRVEQPGVAGFGREQDKLTNSDDAPMAVSRPALDVADLVGEAKAVPLHHLFARRRRIAFRSGISPSSKRCGRVPTNVRSTSTSAFGRNAQIAVIPRRLASGSNQTLSGPLLDAAEFEFWHFDSCGRHIALSVDRVVMSHPRTPEPRRGGGRPDRACPATGRERRRSDRRTALSFPQEF